MTVFRHTGDFGLLRYLVGTYGARHVEVLRRADDDPSALERIEPGMSIFIGTGSSEPRTLVRRLMQSGTLLPPKLHASF